MKSIITLILLVVTLSGCDKNKTTCYECQEDPANTNYRDVGCYTKDDWNAINMTDVYGTNIDKSTKCRKK